MFEQIPAISIEIGIYLGAFLAALLITYLLNIYVYGNKVSIRISICAVATLALYVAALFFFELPAAVKDHTLTFVFVFYGYTGGVTWARIVQKRARKAGAKVTK